jgi:hypothetical protein
MRGVGAIASLFGGIWRKLTPGGGQKATQAQESKVSGPAPLRIPPVPPEVQARINELLEARRKEIDPTGERLAAELERLHRPGGPQGPKGAA